MSEELFEAAKKGEVAYVKKYLEDESNSISIRDDHGLTILHYAAQYKRELLVAYCIKHQKGSQLIDAHTDIGDTPLNTACQNPCLTIVELLIKAGSKINTHNDFGNTPIHYACFFSSRDIAMLLLENRARINILNKFGIRCTARGDLDLNQMIKEKAAVAGLDGTDIKFSGIFNKIQRNREQMFRHVIKKGTTIAVPVAAVQNMSDKIAFENDDHIIRTCTFKVTKMHLRELKHQIIRDEHHRELIFDDLQELRLLSIPNVSPVCGAIIKVPDSLSLLTERFDKGTLRDFLSTAPTAEFARFDPTRALLHIMNAIGYLLHLKLPARSLFMLSTRTIRIDDDLNVLIDLGSAMPQHLKPTPMVFRDVSFVAPEVLGVGLAKTSQIDAAAHAYSTGMICVELLTRRPPFHFTENAATSEFLLAKQILFGIVSPALPPQYDGSPLRKIALLCTKKLPEGRPTFEKLIPILNKLVVSRAGVSK